MVTSDFSWHFNKLFQNSVQLLHTPRKFKVINSNTNDLKVIQIQGLPTLILVIFFFFRSSKKSMFRKRDSRLMSMFLILPKKTFFQKKI